jgi:NAD(P)-dependent dehydrogenase (short-subunit alcohol dehydrogenase family)
VVCGRREPDSLPSIGDNHADFLATDVRQPEQVEQLFATILERYARLDVLVNNAGGSPYCLAADATAALHEKIIALNLTAPLLLAQHANRIMQQQPEGGVILSIASVSALRPSPGTAAYGAAKAGILSLTQSLAVEWAPRVRVAAVSAGLVKTESAHLHYGDEAAIDRVAQTIPASRMAEPADIGNACVFLASPEAAYISGSNLLVHGGGEKPAFLAAASVNRD